MGIQRHFNRHGEGRFPEEKGQGGKTLAAQNEILSEDGRILHATKGFRPISEKRGRVQMLMAEQRAGKFPYAHQAPAIILPMMKKFIQIGLWK
jgi:hypothetical protein